MPRWLKIVGIILLAYVGGSLAVWEIQVQAGRSLASQVLALATAGAIVYGTVKWVRSTKRT